MTDLNTALRAAKVRLDRAARDCLLNLPGAAERADQALAQVAYLWEQLKARRNRGPEPGCDRITLHGGRCDEHRPAPVGEWAIAAQVRDEQQQGQKE